MHHERTTEETPLFGTAPQGWRRFVPSMPHCPEVAVPECLTGLARCITKPFTDLRDFMQSDWFGVDTDDGVSHSQSCISTQTKKSLKLATFFVADTIRIYTITQVLLQRLVFQLVHERLPENLKKDATVNALLLFLPAALLAVFSTGQNIYKKYQSGSGNTFHEKYESGEYPKTETFLFALLSGSQGIMLFDLLYPLIEKIAETSGSEIGDIARTTTYWILSLIGVASLGALLKKLAFPDTSDDFIFRRFREKSGPAFSPVSYGERILNAIGGIAIGAGAASTATWAINRELHNGTVAAGPDEMAALLGIAIASGVFGAITTTDYPKWFHALLILTKFVSGAAMGVASFSGHGYFIAPDPEKTESSPVYMTLWPIFYFGVGAFNASITEYQFENAHKANLMLLRWIAGILPMIAGIPAKIKSCVVGCCCCCCCCAKKDAKPEEESVAAELEQSSVVVFYPGDADAISASASARSSLVGGARRSLLTGAFFGTELSRQVLDGDMGGEELNSRLLRGDEPVRRENTGSPFPV